MPLPIPNLDDRTFNDLTAEGNALIPRNLPQWTDYNPSDPGITLLELFAFVVEASFYQINRVPDRSLLRFAAMVGVTPQVGESVQQTLFRAQQAARSRISVVTGNEFESHALQIGSLQLIVQSATGFALTVSPFNTTFAYPVGTRIQGPRGITTTLSAAIPANSTGLTHVAVADASFGSSLGRGDTVTLSPIVRAKVLAQPGPVDDAVYPPDEYIQIVIVPSTAPKPAGTDLRQTVFESLRALSLIATDIKVTEASYTQLSIVGTVVADASSHLSGSAIQQNVTSALTAFLDPLVGGTGSTGWTFGRSVFRSELYQVIQGVKGVDHVRELSLNGDALTDQIPLASADSLVSMAPGSPQITVVTY